MAKSRRKRKELLRGKHAATNPDAPIAKASDRNPPFTTRTSIPVPLYDQVVQQLNFDPIAEKKEPNKVGLTAGLKYAAGTRVPIYGYNVPDPFEPEKYQKDLEN